MFKTKISFIRNLVEVFNQSKIVAKMNLSCFVHVNDLTDRISVLCSKGVSFGSKLMYLITAVNTDNF